MPYILCITCLVKDYFKLSMVYNIILFIYFCVYIFIAIITGMYKNNFMTQELAADFP